MVRRSMLVSVVLVMSCGIAWTSILDIDFNRKYKEAGAEALFQNKKYAEAQEAFKKLAETAADDLARDMWRARAAVALGMQDEMADEGLKAAAQVDDRCYAVYAQITIMLEQRDYQGVLDKFGDEDISSWPERELPKNPRYRSVEDARCLAAFDRGRAWQSVKNGEAAMRDYALAEKHATSSRRKRDIWAAQAWTAARLLEDQRQAFEANNKIAGMKSGGAAYFRAVISTAGYLRNEGRYEEALEMVERMEPHGKSGHWLNGGMSMIASIKVAQGAYDEAIEIYRALAADESVRDVARSAARLNLAKTLLKSGDQAAARTVLKELAEDQEIRRGHREEAQKLLEEMADTQ